MTRHLITILLIIVTSNLWVFAQDVNHKRIPDSFCGGLNIGQWGPGDYALGVHGSISRKVFTKEWFDIHFGLFSSIAYKPTPLFYNTNGGKARGIDFNIQLPQVLVGSTFFPNSRVSLKVNNLVGLTSSLSYGKFTNSIFSLEPETYSNFQTLFTTNLNVTILFRVKTEAYFCIEYYHPLQSPSRITPQMVGVSILKRITN